MNDSQSVVAIYPSHSAAESAIRKLHEHEFDMTTLSVVGRDFHTDEHVVGYYNSGDRMKAWGKTGAFWGGIWGLLIGSAFFWVPGIGPIFMAGPLVAFLLSALEGAVVVGGLSALGGALFSVGIPKDSILEYETALKTGKYALIAHCPPDEIAKAKKILSQTSPEKLEDHPASRSIAKST